MQRLTSADAGGCDLHEPEEAPVAVQLQREEQDAAQRQRCQHDERRFLADLVNVVHAAAVPARPPVPDSTKAGRVKHIYRIRFRLPAGGVPVRILVAHVQPLELLTSTTCSGNGGEQASLVKRSACSTGRSSEKGT